MIDKKPLNAIRRVLSALFKGYQRQKPADDIFKVPFNFFEPKIISNPDPKAILYSVTGAGIISITDNPHYIYGETAGFGFSVSWGQHGYVGGVIGRAQALRMADMILDACKDITETEEEEVARRKKELDEFFKSRKI